jgi:hypothetical protein
MSICPPDVTPRIAKGSPELDGERDGTMRVIAARTPVRTGSATSGPDPHRKMGHLPLVERELAR